jgi:hypothetical protein
MTRRIPHDVFQKGQITKDQYETIDRITAGKIVSVYFELRTLLYLGVLLFTTGVGILVYKNIGELGHLVIIGLLILITAACFYYIFTRGPGYSNGVVQGPTPYFDYVVLLGSLLFISVQGYLQFQFDILTENLAYSTLITAVLFFFIAYRFDHLGTLSLAITALASFFSISISSQKWYSGEFFSGSHVYTTAIVFGIALAIGALFLDWKKIKPHFTFTYLNFATLIFFGGAIAAMFMNESRFGFFVLLIYGGCAFAYFMARQRKSFMLLLYAFVAGYVATTYLLAETVLDDPELWFSYSILSCGGFIYFIIRYRNYFSRAE